MFCLWIRKLYPTKGKLVSIVLISNPTMLIPEESLHNTNSISDVYSQKHCPKWSNEVPILEVKVGRSYVHESSSLGPSNHLSRTLPQSKMGFPRSSLILLCILHIHSESVSREDVIGGVRIISSLKWLAQ